jgi:hypothetical protein
MQGIEGAEDHHPRHRNPSTTDSYKFFLQCCSQRFFSVRWQSIHPEILQRFRINYKKRRRFSHPVMPMPWTVDSDGDLVESFDEGEEE